MTIIFGGSVGGGGSGGGGGGDGTIDTNLGSNTDRSLVLWDGTSADLITEESNITVTGGTFNSLLPLNVGTNQRTLVGDGFVRLNELTIAPANSSNRGSLYTKEVSGRTELFYIDDLGQEIQLTNDGSLSASASGSINTNLANSTNNALVLWDGANKDLLKQESSITSDGTTLKSTIPIDIGETTVDRTFIDGGLVSLYTIANNGISAENFKGTLFTQEISGVTELFYLDSDNNQVQLTKNGQLFSIGEAGVTTDQISSTDGAVAVFDGSDGYVIRQDDNLIIDGSTVDSILPVVVGSNERSILGDGVLSLFELPSDPATQTNGGSIYTKDVSGATELFYRDAGGQVVQLTDNGLLNGAGIQTNLGTTTNNALVLWDGTTGSLVKQESSITSDGSTLTSDIPIVRGSTNINDGFIRFTEIGTNPSTSANTGAIFTKDVSNVTELFYLDGDGQEIQITDDGILNGVGIQTVLGSSTDNAMVLWDGTGAENIKQETAVTSNGSTLTSTIPISVGSNGNTLLNDGTITLGELASAPSSASNSGILYTKEVSGITELFYLDSTNQEVQLTDDGFIDSSGIVTALGSTTNNAMMLWDGTDASQAKQEPAVTSNGSALTSTIPVVVESTLTAGADGYAVLGNGNLELTESSVNPSSSADSGVLFTKDVAGVVELFYVDSSNTETQLTDDGTINTVGLQAANMSSTDGALALWDGINADTLTESSLVSVDGESLSVGSNENTFIGDGYVRLGEVADPGGSANTGVLYTKDVSGITELFYQDSDGTVIQVTTNGGLGGLTVPSGTDNALVRYNGTNAVQTSGVTLSDSDVLTDLIGINQTALPSGTGTTFTLTGQAGGTGTGGDVEITGGSGDTEGGDVVLTGGASGGIPGNAVLAAVSGGEAIMRDSGGTGRVVVNSSNNLELSANSEIALNSGQNLTLSSSGLLFTEDTSSPFVGQVETDINSATGQTTTIAAQNATGTNSTGGDLHLKPGTGTLTDGYLELQDADGNARVEVTTDRINLSSDSALTAFIDDEINVETSIKLKTTSNPSNVPNYGTVFSQNFDGTVELFYSNDQGDITRLTNSGGGPSGSFVLPVIDVTRDLTSLNLSNNAVPGQAGGGDVIQEAIDYFIDNADGYHALYLPPGTYQLSEPLIIRNGTGQCRVNMIGGSGNALPFTSGLADGAILQLDGNVTFDADNHAVVYIQGGVGCTFKGIGFHNTANTLPNSATLSNILQRNTYGDWTSPGVRENPASPCAAVAIDPFMNGNPNASALNQYPQLSAQYGTAVSQSEFITFENCSFSGGFVGTAIALPEPNSTTNNILFKDCHWSSNTISSFSRGEGIEFRSPYMEKAYVHFDNEILGPSTYGVTRSQPVLTGIPKIRLSRHVFALNGDSVLNVSNLDVAETASLGEFGVVEANTNHSVKFTGCKFNFLTATEQSIDDGETDYVLLTRCPVEFDACSFQNDSGEGIIKFVNSAVQGSTITLRNSSFLNSHPNDSLGISFTRPQAVKLIDCKAQSLDEGNQTMLNNFLSRYEYFDIGENVSLTKIGSATTGNEATATFSLSISNIAVGDIAVVWDGATAVSLPRVDDNLSDVVPEFTPIGVVTNVNTSTGVVTLGYVSSAVNFAASYELNFTRTLIESGEPSTFELPDYLSGRSSFSSSDSINITFALTPNGGFRQPIGSDYNVLLAPEANETYWVSGKTETAFNLNSSNSASDSEIGWRIEPKPITGNTSIDSLSSLEDISGLTVLIDPTSTPNGVWPTLTSTPTDSDVNGKALTTPTSIAPRGNFGLPNVDGYELVFGNVGANSTFGVFGFDTNEFELADLGSNFTFFIRLQPVNNTGSNAFGALLGSHADFLGANHLGTEQTRLGPDYVIFGNNSTNPNCQQVFTPLTTEHTLIATRTNNTMAVYQNGIQIVFETGLNSYTTSAGQFTLGGWTNTSGVSELFQGTIKIFGIYDNAITSTQALQLHNFINSL